MMKVLENYGIANTGVEHMEAFNWWKDLPTTIDLLKAFFFYMAMRKTVIFP